jgi:hypothetical protein
MAILVKFIIFHFGAFATKVANASTNFAVSLLIGNNSRSADQIVMKSDIGTLY